MSKTDSKEFALKYINPMDQDTVDLMKNEIAVQKYVMGGPGMLQIHKVYEFRNKLWII